MSKLVQRNGDDYPEAAAKHLTDAAVLAREKRFDGAGYLAGYAAECVMKTLIQLEGGRARKYRHQLARLSENAGRLAALPGARTARYHPRITAGHSMYQPGGWQEDLRYRAPAAVPEATAQAWLEQARALYTTTILPMRLDGVI